MVGDAIVIEQQWCASVAVDEDLVLEEERYVSAVGYRCLPGVDMRLPVGVLGASDRLLPIGC